MTAADIPMAMVLKTEAGWNQVEADWRRFLDMQPDGCFVAELDGEPVGTTVTCIFGKVAWVAMVLVAKRARGRGIGTAMMRHGLEFLDARGVWTVRLDATPLGQPIYEKLGFVPEYTLARHEGRRENVGQEAPSRGERHVWIAKRRDLARIVALDAEVTGTDREKLLDRLFHERMVKVVVAEVSGEVAGYLAVRSGSNATQIGPCIGTTEAGTALMSEARSYGTPKKGIFVDVPTRCGWMTRFAEQAGLTAQRKFIRMCRGPRVREDAARLLISSGPELG